MGTSIKTACLFILCSCAFLSLLNCKEDITNLPEQLPELTAEATAQVTDLEIEIRVNIIADGGSEITRRGICWSSENSYPTLEDEHQFKGTGNDPFEIFAVNLTPATTYYIRAFAENALGIAYSANLEITTQPFRKDRVYDVDDNLYELKMLGGLSWFLSNLRVTQLNDGRVTLKEITDPVEWQHADYPAYSWIFNNSVKGREYGAMYNLAAIRTGKLCPEGFRVSTGEDWNSLISFLGGWDVAGGKLKHQGTLHWKEPNLGAEDAVGFKGLPGGIRGSDGAYDYFGEISPWWVDSNPVSMRLARYDTPQLLRLTGSRLGAYVRCVCDR